MAMAQAFRNKDVDRVLWFIQNNVCTSMDVTYCGIDMSYCDMIVRIRDAIEEHNPAQMRRAPGRV